MITESGRYSEQIIGKDITKGELPQYVVPGGYWFASEVVDKESYALTGCTVSPGFSFEDFELRSQKELIDLFPKHEAIITKLTHH